MGQADRVCRLDPLISWHSAVVAGARLVVSGVTVLVALSLVACASPSGVSSQDQLSSNESIDSLDADCAYIVESLASIGPQLENLRRSSERAGESNDEMSEDEVFRGYLGGMFAQRETQRILLEWAATTWPQMEDADLKSVIRSMANGVNWEQNSVSINSICGWQ